MYLPRPGSIVAPLTGSGCLVIASSSPIGDFSQNSLIGAAAGGPMEHHHLGFLRVPANVTVAAKLGVLRDAVGD